MTALLSFEWLKFRKRLMPRTILLLILALTLLAFWGQGTRTEGRFNLLLPRGWLAALSFGALFAPFFWPVLGGSWAGNEYGWGTIRSVFSRRPNRIEHALAALLVLIAGMGLALLAMLLVGTVAGLGVAALTHNDLYTTGIWSGDFLLVLCKGFLTAWYISSFFLLLAYAAAVIARSAAVGIGFGIGITLAQFVLRNIFYSLGGIWKDIAQHFPVLYTNDMITQVVGSKMVPGTNLATVGQEAPSAGQSLVAIAIYSAVLVVLMLIAVRTRDVTA